MKYYEISNVPIVMRIVLSIYLALRQSGRKYFKHISYEEELEV